MLTSQPDVCPTCRNVGRYWDGRRERETWCDCTKGQESLLEAQGRKSRRVWAESGIPERFFDFTLATSPIVSSEIGKRMTKPEWDEDGDEGWDEWWERVYDPWFGSWFLWGEYGAGKTGLAVGYARQFVPENEWPIESVMFCNTPDLLSELRDTYRNNDGPGEREVLARYRDAELLILDDIGAEHVKDTGWLEDRLYQIIGYRHAGPAENTTVFTTNLSPDALGARIGERVMWRIVEMCGRERIVRMKGNLRKEASV